MEKNQVIVRDLSVNFDLPQSDLPDNVFTKAMNFTCERGRFVATKMSWPAPVKSEKGPWDTTPAVFLNIISGQTKGQAYFLASGLTKDYVFDGSSWVDVTSTDKVSGSINSESNLWTTCKLGFNILVSNSEFFPEVWSGQFGESLRSLPFSTTETFKQRGIKCKAIRSHKNFLFALNLTEKGEEFPYSYRWSHPADENGLPFSWDEFDLSTLASKESVGGDYGVIVDGLSLRDSFCIYTERAIHILDYTGDEFVFRRRLLTTSYGCLSQNCVVEAENLHYVITASDIIVNDGTSVQSLLTNHLKTAYSSVSQRYFANSFAVVNPAKTEIWFCFPEGNYEFPSLAIVYNYVTKQFGLTRLYSKNNGIGVMSSICFNSILANAYPWDDLDTYFSTWDDWNLPVDTNQFFTGSGVDGEASTGPIFGNTDVWDNSISSPLQTDLFCIGPTFSFIEQLDGKRRTGASSESAYRIVTLFEKTNWALEGQVIVKTLTRIYPNISVTGSHTKVDGTEVIDAGQAKIYVGAHDFNGSAIRWNEPILFDPINDRKIDVRATGELLAIRFEFRGFYSVDFYGFTAEYTLNGVR